MKELIIATKNPGKAREYRAMLEPFGYHVSSLLDHPDFPDIEETGSTFAENAQIKALAASGFFAIPCLADDSGLEVEALNGAPGIHSQRYTPEGTYLANNARLLREMVGVKNRNARFVCDICLCDPAGNPKTYEGIVFGVILETPRGLNGFGYDPLFYLPDQGKSMAELPEDVKNSLSHRGKALRKMLADLPGASR